MTHDPFKDWPPATRNLPVPAAYRFGARLALIGPFGVIVFLLIAVIGIGCLMWVVD